IEIVREAVGPVLEHLAEQDVVSNGECQIQVRPSIAAAQRQGADDRSRDDARVVASNPDDVGTGSLAVLDAIHGSIPSPNRYPGSPDDPGNPISLTYPNVSSHVGKVDTVAMGGSRELQ